MFVLVLLVFLYCGCVTAFPQGLNKVANMNSSKDVSNVVEVPLVQADMLEVDRRFTVRFQAIGEDLDERDTYMNAIYFLYEEATLDFMANLPGTKMVSERPWKKVAIVVTPLPDHHLQRRFVIWGLYQSLFHLAEHEWISGTFFLRWDNEEVGILVFLANDDEPDLDLPGSNSTTLRGLNSQSSSSSAFSSLSSSAPLSRMGEASKTISGEYDNSNGTANTPITIDPTYMARAAWMGKPGTYLPIAASLSWVACWRRDDIVESFTAKNQDYHTALIVENLGTGTEPQGPPAFAIDILDSLWEVALFMDSQQKFEEVRVEINTYGRLIAKMWIIKTRSTASNYSSIAASSSSRSSFNRTSYNSPAANLSMASVGTS